MSASPPAAVGLPLYRGGAHLAEALESLLLQSFDDFRIAIISDSDDDESAELVGRYAAVDPRIALRRNENLGMIRNWRAVFEFALEIAPSARYFAWASDHDVWHPSWLEALVDALDATPDAVLACPRVQAISDDGIPLPPGRRVSCDTSGITSPGRRLSTAVKTMAPGNMVYGLYRVDALERVGVLPAVLLPDRLLLSKLSLCGTFREVRHVLWYRRYFAGVFPSPERQRASIWPRARPPYARLPWWSMHIGAMWGSLVVRGELRPRIGRLQGLVYAAWFALATLRYHIVRRSTSALRPAKRSGRRLRRHFVRAASKARTTQRRIRRAVRSP